MFSPDFLTMTCEEFRLFRDDEKVKQIWQPVIDSKTYKDNFTSNRDLITAMLGQSVTYNLSSRSTPQKMFEC